MLRGAAGRKESTWKGNDNLVKGYRWISTLDGNTTATPIAGPARVQGRAMPPAHAHCRSTVVPVVATFRELGIDIPEPPKTSRASIRGQVPAEQSYYDWLKRQPAEFQDEALGITRAQLLRKGGLSAEEFARLPLGKNFEPLTLAQMRERAPLVFKRAGL